MNLPESFNDLGFISNSQNGIIKDWLIQNVGQIIGATRMLCMFRNQMWVMHSHQCSTFFKT